MAALNNGVIGVELYHGFLKPPCKGRLFCVEGLGVINALIGPGPGHAGTERVGLVDWLELDQTLRRIVEEQHVGTAGQLLVAVREGLDCVTDTGGWIIVVVVQNDANVAVGGLVC